jgi:hypothetical protein
MTVASRSAVFKMNPVGAVPLQVYAYYSAVCLPYNGNITARADFFLDGELVKSVEKQFSGVITIGDPNNLIYFGQYP